MTHSPSPERTCIACRRKAPYSELLRLCRVAGEVVVHAKGVFGRSAYICAEPSCISRAFDKTRLALAVRVPLSEEQKSRLRTNLECKLSRIKP